MARHKIIVSVNENDIVYYDNKLSKVLEKLPKYILEKFGFWEQSVNQLGIEKVRESKGFHDEPLKGIRDGQRSVRLSKSYRVIYVEDKQIIRITD